MNRNGELVTGGAVSIETYVDGSVRRPQPRVVGRSGGPMTGAVLDDLCDDIAHVIDELGRGFAAVLGHASGHIVARNVATNHPANVSAAIVAAAAGKNVPPESTPHPCTPVTSHCQATNGSKR